MPTYVEYGAADIGIVGEDTILEEQTENLRGVGLWASENAGCASAAPKENEELLKHQELIRVATKYPQHRQRLFL